MSVAEPIPRAGSIPRAGLAAVRHGGPEPEHYVQFYEQDSTLIESVDRFIRDALDSGAAAIVIASRAHRESLERAWRSAGLDRAEAVAAGQLILLDAAEMLARISRGRTLERGFFVEEIGSLIARTAERFPRVAAFGEMVALLWADGDPDAAIQLEALWNELLRARPFTLYCAYPLRGGAHALDAALVGSVCREHTRVIPGESYTALPDDERLRAVSELQHKAHALDQEVPRRKAAESRLLEREGEVARLAAIVESSDDAILSKALDGTIQSWNAAAARLFGFSAEEAIGRPITLIVPPELLDEQRSLLVRIGRGERISNFETLALTRDGRRVPVALTVSPVRDSRGEIAGASTIARDITQRRRAEEALRDADRRKDEFLALLAHELRNPLAPIRYAVAMSAKPGCSPDQRARADAIIERQVEHMSHLLDDLLDVSRISRGAVELRKRRLDLASVIAAAVETARPLIEAKRHALTLDLPQEAVRLHADPVRLAQIFSNLLINAAKYTDPGGRIAVEATLAADTVAVTVRDDGIGIAAEIMPRLFTLFAQARPALERAEGGLGIGLALVRGLAELHGGTVEARSEGTGRGSSFVVRLPISAGPEESRDARERGALHEALTLVVADDNRDNAETCAALLELAGHHVETAHNGRRALELAERLRPDALLLDIGMPELNGYQVAERVRAMPWGRDMLLIAVSGWGQEEDRRRAAEAGFDHHLTKPLDPDALAALLQSLRPPRARC